MRHVESLKGLMSSAYKCDVFVAIHTRYNHTTHKSINVDDFEDNS